MHTASNVGPVYARSWVAGALLCLLGHACVEVANASPTTFTNELDALNAMYAYEAALPQIYSDLGYIMSWQAAQMQLDSNLLYIAGQVGYAGPGSAAYQLQQISAAAQYINSALYVATHGPSGGDPWSAFDGFEVGSVFEYGAPGGPRRLNVYASLDGTSMYTLAGEIGTAVASDLAAATITTDGLKPGSAMDNGTYHYGPDDARVAVSNAWAVSWTNLGFVVNQGVQASSDLNTYDNQVMGKGFVLAHSTFMGKMMNPIQTCLSSFSTAESNRVVKLGDTGWSSCWLGTNAVITVDLSDSRYDSVFLFSRVMFDFFEVVGALLLCAYLTRVACWST